MKLSEIKPLKEHRTVPKETAVSKAQQLEWLAAAKLLDGVSVGYNSSSEEGLTLSIFMNELSRNQRAIVLTPRTDQETPVAYCLLEKDGAYWKVIDVVVDKQYRRMGVAPQLYASLSALGYKLMSGDPVSPSAESVWKFLGAQGKAKVLDTQTGKVEPFSDLPIGSGNLATGEPSRYHWVTEGVLERTFYCSAGGSQGLVENAPAFLRGDTYAKTKNFALLGMGGFIMNGADLTEDYAIPLAKAGFMPYVIEDGEPVFLFMKSSDPNYGGPDPAIAKGGIDDGETSLEAAMREGREELGLLPSNIVEVTIKKAFNGTVTGTKESYNLTVFIGQVKNRERFGKFHYETASTHWLTAAQFAEQGTQHQLKIVKKAAKLVRDNL